MKITTDAAMTFCGGYKGADGSGKYADAVNIPSALDTASVTLPYSNLCGQSFAAALTTSICSKIYTSNTHSIARTPLNSVTHSDIIKGECHNSLLFRLKCSKVFQVYMLVTFFCKETFTRGMMF